MADIINPEDGKTWSFHVDVRMMRFLDKVKQRVGKKDKDFVVIIDGYEGAGKSTLGLQMARYVDPTLSMKHVCMTVDNFKKAVIGAEKGQAVIYDEAVTGLTAGDSISRIGKVLKSMMMQMRQKNLFVIVILPTIFELSKYAVLSRAKGLFHVYEKDGRMGYWVYYNRKDLRLLYLKGKKTHSYSVRSYYSGRFYGKYAVDEEEYRKKKSETLFMLDDEEKSGDKRSTRWEEQRDYLLWMLKKSGEKRVNIAKMMNGCRFKLSKTQLTTIFQKMDESYGKGKIVDGETP